MLRWIWILVALGVSTSVYFTIRYGLRPKPIPVLNPTEFSTLDEVGTAMYKRLRQNIRAERVLLLGSGQDIKDSLLIWSGLMRAAVADREKLIVFSRLADPGFPADLKTEMFVFEDAMLQDGRFVDEVKKRIKMRQLVVILAHTKETTHLVDGSLSRQLEKAVRHPVLSLSTLKLAIDKDGLDSLQPQCLDASEDPDGVRRLGCAAVKVARKFAKKKLSPDKMWAVAERHGLKEYLVFIYEPPAPTAEPAVVNE